MGTHGACEWSSVCLCLAWKGACWPLLLCSTSISLLQSISPCVLPACSIPAQGLSVKFLLLALGSSLWLRLETIPPSWFPGHCDCFRWGGANDHWWHFCWERWGQGQGRSHQIWSWEHVTLGFLQPTWNYQLPRNLRWKPVQCGWNRQVGRTNRKESGIR